MLYCEVAKESKATAIAGFCWNVIKITDNPQDMRVIHCMRFLRDAFKGRLECIQLFRADLAEYIYEHIDEDSHMISVKLAVETVGLLEDKDIDRCIVKAMNLRNSWIDETAFKSCRHLPKISKELKKRLIYYIDSIKIKRFFNQKDDLMFSLSLSEGLRKVKKFLNIKLIDGMLIFLPIFLTLIFISPLFGFILLVSSFIPIFLEKRDIFSFGMLRGFLFFVIFFIILLIFFEASKKPLHSTTISFAFNPFGLPLNFLETIWLLSFLPLIPFYRILKIRYFKYELLKIEFELGLPKLKNVFLTIFVTIAVLGWIVFIILGDDIISVFISEKAGDLIPLFFLSISIYWGMGRLWRRFVDYRRVIKLNPNNFHNRESIFELFMALKTERGRMRFVNFLETNIKEVEGEWPDGYILKVSNTEPYIRLAQLEEKWLGINR